MSLQVKDQDGNLSNVSTLTVSLVNVFEVIGFQTTPSGFDATFNRAPVLSDVNLYDGVDVADDLPDVVLHDVTTNTDVRGSLVWNGTTNTLSFVKTGGLLAPDTYNVTLRCSLNGFHDASGHLLDGNGDLNDTQVNDNLHDQLRRGRLHGAGREHQGFRPRPRAAGEPGSAGGQLAAGRVDR